MGAAAVLTISKNGETVKVCSIEGDAMLGRSEGCVIRLEDRAISREHVMFKLVEGGVQVEKRSEFAPLVVNGIDATRAILREADVISIGPYLMKLSLAKSAAATSVLQLPPLGEAAMPAQTAILDALEPIGAEPLLPSLDDPGVGLADSSLVPAEFQASAPAIESAVPELPAFDAGDSNAEPKLELGAVESSPAELVAPPDAAMGLLSLPEEIVEQADDDARTKLTPMGKLSVHLIFAPGTANVTDFELVKDEVCIGRGKSCDIIINDKKSSRKNTIVRRAGPNFTIKDLESANGTYVNGVKIKEQELSSDDVIKIGAVEFTFKAMSADYAARERDFMPVPEDPIEASLPSIQNLMGEAPVDAGMGMNLQSMLQHPAPVAPGGPGPLGVGIPGITGIGPADTKRMGLFEKIRNFKDLPRRQQIVLAVILIGLAYFIFIDDDDEVAVKKKVKPKAGVIAATGSKVPTEKTFEMLSPENQRFVEAQHNLGFDYYKNKEYDMAIAELNKIFALINDYKDSRDIVRYAEEGKRKLQAFEEERRKKEEEAQLKAKVQALVQECGERMKKKQYEQAKELFTQISLIDPDNAQIAIWKKEIDQADEDKRAVEQTKQVQEEINKRAWEVYKEALLIEKQGHYHTAIEGFGKVGDIGASDPRPLKFALREIRKCRAAIRALRDPVLAEAKLAEDAQDYPKAFALYKKATKIDPPHPAGYAGMARIRTILHDRAKLIYTEAILAESFSDFTVARKKFKECLEVAPADDIYHERSERKLARYFKREEANSQ